MALTDNTTGGRTIKEGILPVKVTLSDTCEVGDLLGASGATWVRALATTPNQIHARLVAGERGISGDIITAYAAAIVYHADFGATVAGLVYPAESTLKGETSQTAASTTGDINAPYGIAISATDLLLIPGFMPVYHDTDHVA